MAEESVRAELVKHISAEITTHAQYLNTLRSRMGFTVLLGPFLVLGSVVFATKSIAFAWPSGRLPWAFLALAVLCYLGLGLYGSRLDEHGTDQCNAWRKTILSVVNNEPLTNIKLDFPHRQKSAYLAGFTLALGALVGMTVFLLSTIQPS